MGAADAARGRIAEIAEGVGSLAHGFVFWRHRPGAMLLGLLPALLSGVVLLAGLVVLASLLDPIAVALTPFAERWDAFWRTTTRVVVATSLIITAGILSARVFTALALTLGGPVYERIGAIAEEAHGGVRNPVETGFWRSLTDMGRIVLGSVLASLVIGIIGLVPVVGGATAAVLGVILPAVIVSREFTLQPLRLRGLGVPERQAVLRGSRVRALSFGLAVQLCHLVPLGAVLVMPAAVAGAVRLTRLMLGEPVEVRPRREPVVE